MPCPRCGSVGRNPACGRCSSRTAEAQSFVDQIREEAAAIARVTVRQVDSDAARLRATSEGRSLSTQEARVNVLREKVWQTSHSTPLVLIARGK